MLVIVLKQQSCRLDGRKDVGHHESSNHGCCHSKQSKDPKAKVKAKAKANVKPEQNAERSPGKGKALGAE